MESPDAEWPAVPPFPLSATPPLSARLIHSNRLADESPHGKTLAIRLLREGAWRSNITMESLNDESPRVTPMATPRRLTPPLSARLTQATRQPQESPRGKQVAFRLPTDGTRRNQLTAPIAPSLATEGDANEQKTLHMLADSCPQVSTSADASSKCFTTESQKEGSDLLRDFEFHILSLRSDNLQRFHEQEQVLRCEIKAEVDARLGIVVAMLNDLDGRVASAEIVAQEQANSRSDSFAVEELAEALRLLKKEADETREELAETHQWSTEFQKEGSDMLRDFELQILNLRSDNVQRFQKEELFLRSEIKAQVDARLGVVVAMLNALDGRVASMEFVAREQANTRPDSLTVEAMGEALRLLKKEVDETREELAETQRVLQNLAECFVVTHESTGGLLREVRSLCDSRLQKLETAVEAVQAISCEHSNTKEEAVCNKSAEDGDPKLSPSLSAGPDENSDCNVEFGWSDLADEKAAVATLARYNKRPQVAPIQASLFRTPSVTASTKMVCAPLAISQVAVGEGDLEGGIRQVAVTCSDSNVVHSISPRARVDNQKANQGWFGIGAWPRLTFERLVELERMHAADQRSAFASALDRMRTTHAAEQRDPHSIERNRASTVQGVMLNQKRKDLSSAQRRSQSYDGNSDCVEGVWCTESNPDEQRRIARQTLAGSNHRVVPAAVCHDGPERLMTRPPKR